MAGDLVQSPETSHVVAHDLESFFWVLLWVTVNFVFTNWEQGMRSFFIDNTMSPPVYGDDGSEVTGNTGGDAKIHFLRDDYTLGQLEIPQCPPLLELINAWKATLAERHCPPGTTVEAVTTGKQGIYVTKPKWKGATNVVVIDADQKLNPYVFHGAPPFTHNHDCMLGQINLVLNDPMKWLWPKGDKASPRPISHPAAVLRVSSNILKRPRVKTGLQSSSVLSKKLREGREERG